MATEQLLKLVEHYNVDIGDKRLKEEIKGSFRAALIEHGVLQSQVAVLRLWVLLQ